MSEIKISIIICSRNRAELLEKCLNSFLSLKREGIAFELILVDSDSTDNTLDTMLSFKKTAPFLVKVINVPKKGLGLARNTGIKSAEGEIYVFTDDDCFFEKNYLIEVMKYFPNNQFQFCGGRIFLWDQTDSTYGCNFQSEFELIPPYSFIPAGKIQGANLVVHKSVIEKIKGFDSMLGAGTPFRCEDIDFFSRATMAGFSAAHLPELIVYHNHGRKPGKDIEELKKANDYARGAFYAKMILLGYKNYFKSWLNESIWKSNQKGKTKYLKLYNELNGALSYGFTIFKKRFNNE